MCGTIIWRRRATQRCAADRPSPSGCGGSRSATALLLLDVSLALTRLHRRALWLTGWRSQRGLVFMMLGALEEW